MSKSEGEEDEDVKVFYVWLRAARARVVAGFKPCKCAI
jgi:hypothetical protein